MNLYQVRMVDDETGTDWLEVEVDAKDVEEALDIAEAETPGFWAVKAYDCGPV